MSHPIDQWLKELGFSKYLGLFAEHEIGLDVLPDLADAEFEKLGIPLGDRKRLLKAIASLSDRPEEGAAPEVPPALSSEAERRQLAVSLDLEQRTLRFHDTVRQFLQDRIGKDGLIAQHQRLIHAMGDIGGAEETPAAEVQYFYLHLPHHLSEAGGRETLDALLLDPGWLRAKLEATGSPQALVADYEQHGQGQMQSLIGRTLRLTAGILARDERQLLPQLLGRLMACEDARAALFLDEARRLVSTPAILTQHPSLSPPGAEIARLEGHTDAVTALTQLADGRIASGSEDDTIRLWDPATGAETARLEGHTGYVTALTQLADGHLASGSWDNTIRLWDPATGAERICPMLY